MKSELKEIKQVLESIKTFIVANAQLQKETQSIERERKLEAKLREQEIIKHSQENIVEKESPKIC